MPPTVVSGEGAVGASSGDLGKHMSEFVTDYRSADQDAKKTPNTVDVGAWLTTARSLRQEFASYVPRHRAPGLAV